MVMEFLEKMSRINSFLINELDKLELDKIGS
jgi:hypothetical protein